MTTDEPTWSRPQLAAPAGPATMELDTVNSQAYERTRTDSASGNADLPPRGITQTGHRRVTGSRLLESCSERSFGGPSGMIAILDYGAGNLRSVAKALETVGATPVITDDARVFSTA